MEADGESRGASSSPGDKIPGEALTRIFWASFLHHYSKSTELNDHKDICGFIFKENKKSVKSDICTCLAQICLD